jgi:hypothetical protein
VFLAHPVNDEVDDLRGFIAFPLLKPPHGINDQRNEIRSGRIQNQGRLAAINPQEVIPFCHAQMKSVPIDGGVANSIASEMGFSLMHLG